jgi:hypothetical protein
LTVRWNHLERLIPYITFMTSNYLKVKKKSSDMVICQTLDDS